MTPSPPPKMRPMTSEKHHRDNRKQQDLWKKIFDLYAAEGKLEGKDNFEDFMHGTGSRFLNREIDEVYEKELGGARLGFQDVKNLTLREPALETMWQQQQDLGKGGPKLSHDIFEQMFVAFQFLLDSSPDTSKIDVSYLAYVLNTCGEELNTDYYDEFIKTIKHTTKGPFHLGTFMEKYAEFARKVGVFTDEDVKNAQGWIVKAEEKYGLKKKNQSRHPTEKEGQKKSEHGHEEGPEAHAHADGEHKAEHHKVEHHKPAHNTPSPGAAAIAGDDGITAEDPSHVGS